MLIKRLAIILYHNSSWYPFNHLQSDRSATSHAGFCLAQRDVLPLSGQGAQQAAFLSGLPWHVCIHLTRLHQYTTNSSSIFPYILKLPPLLPFVKKAQQKGLCSTNWNTEWECTCSLRRSDKHSTISFHLLLIVAWSIWMQALSSLIAILYLHNPPNKQWRNYMGCLQPHCPIPLDWCSHWPNFECTFPATLETQSPGGKPWAQPVCENKVGIL